MTVLTVTAALALSPATPWATHLPWSTGEGSPILLEEHFTWGPGRLQTGTSRIGDTRAEVSGGQYLLTALNPGVSHVGSYAPFDQSAEGVSLSTTVELVSGRVTGVGLGCMDRRTGTGFLVAVEADLSTAGIWWIPPDGAPVPIAEWSGEPGGTPRSLQVECRADSAGTTRVTGSADGRVLVTSPEVEGPAAFTGLAVDVLEPSVGAEVAFDDLLARELGRAE